MGTDVSPPGVGVPLHTCTNKGPLFTASHVPGTVLLEKPQMWGSSWLRQSLCSWAGQGWKGQGHWWDLQL